MADGKGPHKRSYRIPNEQQVTEAVRSILDDAVTVRSQTLFRRLVTSRIRKMEGNGGFKLSAKRLRRVAAHLDDVDLIIHCREGNKAYRGSVCPVCGSQMEDIKNKTLYGWTVATGKLCTTCSYWTGNRKRIPTRYVFTVEKENYLKEEK